MAHSTLDSASCHSVAAVLASEASRARMPYALRKESSLSPLSSSISTGAPASAAEHAALSCRLGSCCTLSQASEARIPGPTAGGYAWRSRAEGEPGGELSAPVGWRRDNSRCAGALLDAAAWAGRVLCAERRASMQGGLDAEGAAGCATTWPTACSSMSPTAAAPDEARCC